MSYSDLVQPIIERKDLTQEQAENLMSYLISGESTDAQIGGILLGLRIKGCTTRELAAFASIMRSKATLLGHEYDDLVDTCGTGGGKQTFNISTASAIVAAAAGARIAKHGNRSVTGMGSADVLESLGVRIGADPEALLHSLDTTGIVFLFSQAHHPAMKHVAKARKELGLRTVFNQLGPLSNPAGARRQLIGVYEPGLMRSMGEALKLLGSERALLVHGLEGLDEISPCGETEVVKVWDGRVSTERLRPSDFGVEPIDPSALTCGDNLKQTSEILLEAITDADSPRCSAILPSAGAAIWLAGLEDSLAAATNRARAFVKNGAARDKLNQLIGSGGSA